MESWYAEEYDVWMNSDDEYLWGGRQQQQQQQSASDG